MKNKKLMSILLVSAILGTTLGTTAVSAADETSVSLWTWSPITRTAEKMIDAFDSPEVSLYYTSDGSSSQLINTFNLFLPGDDELKKETAILLDEVKDKTYTAKVDEFLAYMNDFYGKANKQNAMDWLKTNFNLVP